jgi:hypothetical protein
MYRPFPKTVYHSAKQAEAQARISEMMRLLRAEQTLPDGAAKRAALIASRGNLSMTTLYKAANKPFWHPQFEADESHAEFKPSFNQVSPQG